MTGAAAPRDTRAPALPSTGAPAKASAAVAAPIRDLAASTPRADVPVAAGAGPDPADAASASSRPPVPAPVHERVATPAPDGALGAPPWAAAATPVSGNPDAPVVTVKLAPAAPEQWRQPLAEALGDRLRLQLGRGSEQAVIRLDPPMLGRIEISIRHEAGSLQVQLSASNGDVLRQLHGIGDGLRQELSQRQQGEVSVVVSDSSRDAGAGGDQRGRGRDAKDAEDRPGRALTEAGTDDAARAGFGLAREGRDAA
jgi:type III secretion system needle length determinant